MISMWVLSDTCFAKLPPPSNSTVNVAGHRVDVQPHPEAIGSAHSPIKHTKEMLLKKIRNNHVLVFIERKKAEAFAF